MTYLFRRQDFLKLLVATTVWGGPIDKRSHVKYEGHICVDVAIGIVK